MIVDYEINQISEKSLHVENVLPTISKDYSKQKMRNLLQEKSEFKFLAGHVIDFIVENSQVELYVQNSRIKISSDNSNLDYLQVIIGCAKIRV